MKQSNHICPNCENKAKVVAIHFDKNEQMNRVERIPVFYCVECDTHFKIMEISEEFAKRRANGHDRDDREGFSGF